LVPDAGTNYSYVKSYKVNVPVAPDTSITNMNLYTDGANGMGTGITWNIGDEQPATYVQATGTEGTTGNIITTVYSGTITGVTDFFGYTDGSEYSVTLTANSGTGIYTNVIGMQIYVASTASKGAKSAETFVLEWDEV